LDTITGYLQEARQRLHEFGGFWQMDPEQLSGPLGWWADSLWVRAEPGLTTLVALLPAAQEVPVNGVRDALATIAREVRTREGTEVQVILLVVLGRPITRGEYAQWQELKLNEGPVRVVLWPVDLVRGRLFQHAGPPFGVDPDLGVLLSPAVPAPEAAPPAVRWRDRVQEQGPRPWVTIALVAAIAIVWVVMTIAGGSLDATESTNLLQKWGAAARPDLWLDHQEWRLFTAVFIHIGIIHVALNGWNLWIVGKIVEAFFGSVRTLFIFVVAGVAGSAASAMLGLPMVLSAGASGAIFGLLGAVIWYRISSPLGERIAWRPLLLTLALNLGLGLALYNFVDNWNHVGGLLGGLLAAAVVGTPAVAGLPRPRYLWPRPARIAGAGALLIGAVLLVAGVVAVPGRGHDLAQSITLVEQGRASEAEPGLVRATQQQPDEPTLHWYLLQVYVHEGRCDEAAKVGEQVLKLAPEARPDVVQKLQECRQRKS
jgi:membrane associated rhomboid family serine protease